MDVSVKVLKISEIFEGAKVFLKAFDRHDNSMLNKIVNLWSAMKENKIGYFLAAKSQNKIIGTGAIFLYNSLAWIGYMSVEPTLQHQGIGSKILKALLRYAENREIDCVRLDATNKGRKLYFKHGFSEEYEVGVYEIRENEDISYDNQFNIGLMTKLPIRLLDLDKQAFGEDRSLLLNFLLEQNSRAIIAEKFGYGIVSDNRIGPVIAENVDVAIEIVKYASQLGGRRIIVPSHEKSEELLTNLNLKEIEGTRCTRMLLGEEIKEDVQKLYASYSFATG